MSDVMAFEKGPTGVFERADTLDALWAEAEALGRVGVDPKFSGGYRATVNFRTTAGSNVFAHGDGRRPHDALQCAMAEARQLGAGQSR